MLSATQPYIQKLDDTLVLKSVSTAEEVERLDAFDVKIFGEGVRSFVPRLILDHPATHPDHWLYVEDTATGEVVSSLCLIPWIWHYEDVELRSGEVGVVGTAEAYRHRGLVRALMVRHHELLHAGEYDLSHIQGIPYYYRQYGYEYAIPLEGGWRIEPHAIPEQAGFTFRLATVEDIPLLMYLYDEAAADLEISIRRDAAAWRYLLGPSMGTDTAAETWLVLDASQQVAGYFRIARFGFGEGLNFSEASRLSGMAASAVLAQCKKLAAERQKPYIRLNIPGGHVLVRLARHLGGHDLGTYAWQIHLPDVARLLRKLAPVFERRIAASAFAGLTRSFVINLYREAYELVFEAGCLRTVRALGFRGDGDLHLPPLLLAPLVLGHRTFDDLRQGYPDVSSGGESALLTEVLFPKVRSFLYTIY